MKVILKKYNLENKYRTLLFKTPTKGFNSKKSQPYGIYIKVLILLRLPCLKIGKANVFVKALHL